MKLMKAAFPFLRSADFLRSVRRLEERRVRDRDEEEGRGTAGALEVVVAAGGRGGQRPCVGTDGEVWTHLS